jgi:hypothetical protein
MFTKNVEKEGYENHVNKFLGKMQKSNLEYQGKEGYWYGPPIFNG